MSIPLNTLGARELRRTARRSVRFAVVLWAIAAIAAMAAFPDEAAAGFGGWEFQPYRIHALLALDVPGGLAEELSGELPVYLRNRAGCAFAPLWVFDIELATGAARAKVFRDVEEAGPEKPTDLPKDTDKLILLAVHWTPLGLQLTAREYDQYVERWGVPLHPECRQFSSLPEQLFALVWQTFSPLAQVDPDPNDPKRATLRPRGSELLRGEAEGMPPWAMAGDVFLPLTRRTARGGQVVENGIQPVPWTYVAAVASEAIESGDQSKETENNKAQDKAKDKVTDKQETLEFHVHSGSRRPFVARRSSRLELLAIGVRADPEPTRLQFFARKNERKPLVGYEALVQESGNEEPTRIGLSDTAGEVVIPPGNERIRILLVKHGGQLLAKLPVVPGAAHTIKIPLPDDDARLAAEARLAALREDLIDVVARRNILMARARKRIENKDFAGAQELLRSLDELPGKPQFKLALDTSARLLRSDDPAMQRKIDGLFSQTQTLMTQFLDLKPINQLHNELREAQQKGPQKAGGT
jgi:hypothetical protein